MPTKDQWVLQTVTKGYHIHCTSHLRTHSGDHAIQPSLLVRESDPAAGGDSYLAGEARVPAQTTKKIWWSETSHQPKKAQLPREVRTLQDGDSPYSEIPSPKGRLDN